MYTGREKCPAMAEIREVLPEPGTPWHRYPTNRSIVRCVKEEGTCLSDGGFLRQDIRWDHWG